MLVWLKLSDGHFGTPKEREDLRTLEDRLESTIAEHEIGQFDGNEVGDGWYTLYIYGPSTDRLGEVLLPIVQVARPPAGSYAIKRYGPPGAREVRIDL